MNSQRLIRAFLKICPDSRLLHKINNRIRLNYHRGYYIPPARVEAVENDPSLKCALLAEYSQKWNALVKKTNSEMDRILTRAPQYIERSDEQKLREDILFCRLAYGFPPDEYVAYELEKKTPKERKEYVSWRDLLCVIYQVNDRLDMGLYNDKARTYDLFHSYYNREAVDISAEQDFDKFHAFVSRHPVFVKKNVKEAMGRGIELIDTTANDETERELFNKLISQGKVLLEEKVVQSEAFSKLNESSVNTVRCITFLTKRGVVVPYCFLKVGRAGSFVDNGGAGGILIGIDSETGCLNTDGYDEYITCFEKHPDSGIRFKGYQLPEFDKVVQMSRELSAMTPSVKFVGWDFAHTEQGWVVIEGNGMSQLIGPQIVQKRGVKTEVKKILDDMELITD